MPTKRLVPIVIGILAAVGTRAGIITQIALVRQDDRVPRRGVPLIRTSVETSERGAAAILERQIRDDLGSLVHARIVTDDGSTDFELHVALHPKELSDAGSLLRFDASLSSSGSTAWVAAGTTEIGGAPAESEVFRNISRNIVAGLIRDGWLQPRYDPANPPPSVPTIRKRLPE